MSEEVSLRDVTVSPNPPAAKPEEPTKPTATEAPVVELKDPTEADALELGRILMGSGIGKEQINQLLEAPKALAGLQSIIKSGDGRQIVQLLRQSGDGAAAERLEETIANYYVEQYGAKNDKGKDDGKAQDSELMGEVAALRNEVQTYRTEREQSQARAAMAATESRYKARVEDFFGQESIKKLGLTKMEQAGMKAMLDKDLAQDAEAVRRISNGNFVDVAPAFKRIAEGWVADKKTAAEAEKRQREGVVENANWTFPGAPSPLEISEGVFDSWDNTEEGFAKALSRTR